MGYSNFGCRTNVLRPCVSAVEAFSFVFQLLFSSRVYLYNNSFHYYIPSVITKHDIGIYAVGKFSMEASISLSKHDYYF